MKEQRGRAEEGQLAADLHAAQEQIEEDVEASDSASVDRRSTVKVVAEYRSPKAPQKNCRYAVAEAKGVNSMARSAGA